MKILSILIFTATLIFTEWLTDFDAAKKTAHQKHQYILLTFTGSDWCGPCIRLHNEIFQSKEFINLTENRLVLLNADFPRLKKNQLSKTMQEQNDRLADRYNSAGSFPKTLLLNAEGTVINQWDGFPKEGAAAFIDELNLAIHVNK